MEPIRRIPQPDDLLATQKAIAPLIQRTPVLTCKYIDNRVGGQVYFKCENFQKVGAFKMRGAASAALRVPEEIRSRGLATHSSGNHAQAVARAARFFGIPAYIVMPENAPRIKVEATRDYGATIRFCQPNQASREEELEKVLASTGAHFIHPYNHYDVIAGQATAAMELLEECPFLDLVMAPVGGGGLLSGTALATHYFRKDAQIIGAEPKRVDDAARSLRSGKIEVNERTDTIADGLRTTLGELTLEILRKYVSEILTAEETGIVNTMRLIWERMKIIVEPSCAVPLAAVLAYPAPFRGKKTGIILTGGNVDLETLPFSHLV